MYIYRKNNSKSGAEKAKKKQRKTLYLKKNFSSLFTKSDRQMDCPFD